jgi:hypothetical protein
MAVAALSCTSPERSAGRARELIAGFPGLPACLLIQAVGRLDHPAHDPAKQPILDLARPRQKSPGFGGTMPLPVDHLLLLLGILFLHVPRHRIAAGVWTWLRRRGARNDGLLDRLRRRRAE